MKKTKAIKSRSGIDKYNMYQVLLDFPKQFKRALAFSKNVSVSGEFDNIIVSGMGGSSLPGELIKTCFSSKIPIFVNRDYSLPEIASKKSLIFASSYSGNTEETLSVYKEAKKRHLKTVGFCSGGQLEQLCKQDKTPFIKYPAEAPGFQPRFALGYAFAAMTRVLSNSGIIKDYSRYVSDTSNFLEKNKKCLENNGISLAKKLKEKTPIIYTSDRLKALGYAWKLKLNETSKILAFYNFFPELNHSEMVAYTNKPKGKFIVVILRDENDYKKILKRMEITAGLIKKKGVDVNIFDLKGKSTLSKIFYSIYLVDWISYYLAIENGIDPTPVKIADDFKKRLKK